MNVRKRNPPFLIRSRSTQRLGYCLTGHQRKQCIEFGPCNDNRGQSEKKTHQIRITNARESAGNNGSIRIWMCGWLADSPDSQLKSTSINNKKHQKSRLTSRMQIHGLLFIESRSFPLPIWDDNNENDDSKVMLLRQPWEPICGQSIEVPSTIAIEFAQYNLAIISKDVIL